MIISPTPAVQQVQRARDNTIYKPNRRLHESRTGVVDPAPNVFVVSFRSADGTRAREHESIIAGSMYSDLDLV